MSKIKVLLADDNKEFCDVIGGYLEKQGDIDVIDCAYDGVTAYKNTGVKTRCCNIRWDNAEIRWIRSIREIR